PAHPVHACRCGRAILQKIAAVPPRSCGTKVGHQSPLFAVFERSSQSSVFRRANISPNWQVSVVNTGLGSRLFELQEGGAAAQRLQLGHTRRLRADAKPPSDQSAATVMAV